MTTTAYMPFSSVNPASAAALLRWFERVTLYQPHADHLPEALNPWLEAGRIELCRPVKDDDPRLTQALAACRQWADECNLGSGAAGAFLKAQPSGPPLYDTDAVGHLRRQILSGGVPAATDAPVDPIFDARLFLAMAAAHDLDNDSAALRLQQLQAMEDTVLHEMHGGTTREAKIGPPAAAIAAGEDRGALMTRERLRAWSILVSQATEAPALLVSDSAAVVAELLEYVTNDLSEVPCLDLELPTEVDEGASCQVQFQAWLDQLLVSAAPLDRFTPEAVGLACAATPRNRVRLYLLVGSPSESLLRTLLPRSVAPQWGHRPHPVRHGLVAHIHSVT